MVQHLHALLALGAERRLGTGFQGLVGRSRSRIRPHRRNLHPGPPAWNRRKRGTRNQAIGKSRGGLTTKIAALVDALGNLVRFVLLPGNVTTSQALTSSWPASPASPSSATRHSMQTGYASIWPAEAS